MYFIVAYLGVFCQYNCHNVEKIEISLDNLEEEIKALLQKIQENLYNNALSLLQEKTYNATTLDEFEKIIKEKSGFIKAMWCGDKNCEDKIKELTTATSRCMPFNQEKISDTCVCCGNKANHMVYWAKAY